MRTNIHNNSTIKSGIYQYFSVKETLFSDNVSIIIDAGGIIMSKQAPTQSAEPGLAT